MKTTTREVLLVLLRADETVSAASVIEAVAVLEGRVPTSPPLNPTLVSKSEAARQLNMSRTTLIKIIQEDREHGVTPPRFVEIETTLGVFRLRQHDVTVFGASRPTARAKPLHSIASQQKLVCQS